MDLRFKGLRALGFRVSGLGLGIGSRKKDTGQGATIRVTTRVTVRLYGFLARAGLLPRP